MQNAPRDYSSSVQQIMQKHKIDLSQKDEERFCQGNRRAAPIVPYVNQYNLPNNVDRSRRNTQSLSPSLERFNLDKISNTHYKRPIVQD